MSDEHGFTLVEALVAFAILATTLVVLYEAMGTSVRAFARSADVDEAVLFAESKLDELAAAKALPQTTESGEEHAPFRWRVERLPDEAPETPELAVSSVRLQRVRLTVWSANGGQQNLTVERLLLLARQSGQ